jgi:glutamyl-tRNA synthetase
MNPERGRLAPSPTGAQHLGNARTFLLAWLQARRQNAELLLRIEDLDTPRTKSWATDQAVDDLRWLGLECDHTPFSNSFPIPLLQSLRSQRYQSALEQLIRDDAIFPCTCSRKDVQQAASAPHESTTNVLLHDSVIYPGTCAHRTAGDALKLTQRNATFAWRFRTQGHRASWLDAVAGPVQIDFDQNLGDFIVARSDGSIAYQLAVVVDDIDQSITQIVRGSDLIPSTARQLLLYHYFQATPPIMFHVPLVCGSEGRRLAKRHGDTRLSLLRDQGFTPESIHGLSAWTSGLIDRFEPISPPDLLALDWPVLISKTNYCFPEGEPVDYLRRLVADFNS